jgi:hypothetical protein
MSQHSFHLARLCTSQASIHIQSHTPSPSVHGTVSLRPLIYPLRLLPLRISQPSPTLMKQTHRPRPILHTHPIIRQRTRSPHKLALHLWQRLICPSSRRRTHIYWALWSHRRCSHIHWALRLKRSVRGRTHLWQRLDVRAARSHFRRASGDLGILVLCGDDARIALSVEMYDAQHDDQYDCCGDERNEETYPRVLDRWWCGLGEDVVCGLRHGRVGGWRGVEAGVGI